MTTRERRKIPNLRAVLLAALLASLPGCFGSPEDDLPPLVYICPMVKDADVLEEHPGKCPKCGMELKPVRIVTAYSCLNNTAFIQEKPGKCITNGTDLVPITASMYWVCPNTPDKRETEPGKCSDRSDRIKKFEPRLHGDHNPRHGGQLFMADDGWHHLEGVYPVAGLFRVYFYDDWTRPLKPAGFAARAILQDAAGKEVGSIPLKPSQIENAMEVEIPNSSLPLSTSLRVRFKENQPEKLFDFTFRDYSKDPSEPPRVTTAPEVTAPPAATPPPAVAVASPSSAPGPVANAVPEPPPQPQPPTTVDAPLPGGAMNAVIAGPLQPEPIPAAARDILVEINARSRELAEKVEQGAPLGEYWFPALRTKDLALALVEKHLNEIPARQRTNAENAASRLLRAAYAIDNFGDLGDGERLRSAYDSFVTAVNDLKSAYASIR